MEDVIASVCLALAPLLTKYVPEADDYRFRFDGKSYRAEALLDDGWQLILIVSHLDEFTSLDEADLKNIALQTETYLQHRKDAQHSVRLHV